MDKKVVMVSFQNKGKALNGTHLVLGKTNALSLMFQFPVAH